MPAPYSEDIRKKRAACYKQRRAKPGRGGEAILVSASDFKRIWKSYQENGRIEPKQRGGWLKPKVDKANGTQIQAWLKACPDLTLAELCER